MPFYDYDCVTCGPFTALRPMAEFTAPAPCPACATASPRQFTSVPQIGGGPGGGIPAAGVRRHPAACGCCGPSRRSSRAAEAVTPPRKKSFLAE